VSRLYGKNRDLSQPLERITLRVDKPDEGRFDAFLAAKLPWRSRSGAQALIEEGSAVLNGEPRKPSTRVRAGDTVTVQVSRPHAEVKPPEISILFEDEHMIALDKPAGAVVHPVGAHQRGTLIQELHRRYPDPLPKLAHRLDQYTSGVLLVAKSDAVRTAFSDMLERGEVRKAYDALVLGRPAWQRRSVTAPIAPVGDSRILMGVDELRGKPARSEFRVEEAFAFAAHVSVRILTGRTHQIRVHASHLGHPLLGDHLYGDGVPVGTYERFALHARRTRFAHPATADELTIEAPLPAAFLDAMALLRQG
jgi:23S rRNA pseudouridine1911/1915/1917 synthase